MRWPFQRKRALSAVARPAAPPNALPRPDGRRETFILDLPDELLEFCIWLSLPAYDGHASDLQIEKERQAARLRLARVNKIFRDCIQRVSTGVIVIRSGDCARSLHKRVSSGQLHLELVRRVYVEWRSDDLSSEEARRLPLRLATMVTNCRELTVSLQASWTRPKPDHRQTVIAELQHLPFLSQLRSLAFVASGEARVQRRGDPPYLYNGTERLNLAWIYAFVGLCPLIESLAVETDTTATPELDAVSLSDSKDSPILPSLTHVVVGPSRGPSALGTRLLKPWADRYEQSLTVDLSQALATSSDSLHLEVFPCRILRFGTLDGTRRTPYQQGAYLGPSIIVADKTPLGAGMRHLTDLLGKMSRLSALHLGEVTEFPPPARPEESSGSAGLMVFVRGMPKTVVELSILDATWQSYPLEQQKMLEDLFRRRRIAFSAMSKQQVQEKVWQR